jgi:hypothetical protein
VCVCDGARSCVVDQARLVCCNLCIVIRNCSYEHICPFVGVSFKDLQIVPKTVRCEVVLTDRIKKFGQSASPRDAGSRTYNCTVTIADVNLNPYF